MDTAKLTELIHEGKGFYTYSNVTGLAVGASISMLGRTGALPAHFHNVHVEGSDSPLLIELIEATTVTNVGTPVTVFNRNRRSLNVPDMKVYSAPTFSLGTTIEIRRVYKSGVGAATPGSGIIEGEWVLKSNTDYIFRITNNSGAIINLDADFHFYEEEL
jgi:hypothetical protein